MNPRKKHPLGLEIQQQKSKNCCVYGRQAHAALRIHDYDISVANTCNQYLGFLSF